MILDSETLAPQMQQWVTLTRVISTLLFTYPQVREYSSPHFYVRRLAMQLSVASVLTQRRPSTKATKGVNCLRLFNQLFRYFRFFSRSEVSRHFSRVLDW